MYVNEYETRSHIDHARLFVLRSLEHTHTHTHTYTHTHLPSFSPFIIPHNFGFSSLESIFYFLYFESFTTRVVDQTVAKQRCE